MIKSSDAVSYEIEERRLAHSSVKEFLISNHVRIGSDLQYNIPEGAEDRIAQTCVIYLLQFKRSTLLTPDNINDFPLAIYAAEYWTRQARAATEDSERVAKLSIQLFESREDSCLNWIRLSDPESLRRGVDMKKSICDVAYPLYYASLEGLLISVTSLLELSADVNAQGRYHGNALQAASAKGHEAVVTLLLEKGAGFNAKSRYYGSALHAASYEGHKAIVMLLLDSGADVNAQDRNEETALQAGSAEGHEAVVTLLLENGAIQTL